MSTRCFKKCGWTLPGSLKKVSPMLSAFWLVSGYYQSYETTNFEVELALNIDRMFGRRLRETSRGLPNEALFQKIKSRIDMTMDQNASAAILSRVSEAHAQMLVGKDLAQLNADMGGLIWPDGYQELDAQEAARRRRNAEEAIRAFETVLLLDPENREAKMYLAACLRKQTIRRIDQARDYYREILESSVQDKWTGQAQRALEESFRWSSSEERAKWFERVAQQTTNSVAGEFYRQNARHTGDDNLIQSGEGAKARELAEGRLLKTVRESWGGRPRQSILLNDFYNMFSEYVDSYGTNSADAAKRLVELLPELQQAATNYGPHLLACVVSFQVDTNSPVFAAFEKSFDQCSDHPEKIIVPRLYFFLTAGIDIKCVNLKLFGLAAKVSEGNTRAAAGIYGYQISNDARMELAFGYLTNECWKQALDIFECYSNKPIEMGNSGPWGDAFTVVFTGKQSAYCREKLGLPVTRNPLEFDMGKSVFCLCSPASFISDVNGLWVGINGQLMHLNFDLKTNLVINLPMDASVPITVLCLTSSNIWIGTDGDGLIEFDKASRQCSRLTVKDGLMMEVISCLHLAGDVLWIGFGNKDDPGSVNVSKSRSGGLGQLNLSTRRFTSFTPSLAKEADAPDKPPRRAVRAVIAKASEEAWFFTDDPLRHYRSQDNIWETIPQVRAGCCLAIDAEHLYAGQFWGSSGGPRTGPLGLNILSFRVRQWRGFKDIDGLPSGAVSALPLDDTDLWVGGMGYIALVDPKENRVRKFAYIRARQVDQIQVGGGYVWAQFDGHLYRAPLADLAK